MSYKELLRTFKGQAIVHALVLHASQTDDKSYDKEAVETFQISSKLVEFLEEYVDPQDLDYVYEMMNQAQDDPSLSFKK